MKINIELDMTPDEARRFLGLPDVGEANRVFVDSVAKAMKGVGPGAAGVEQLQDYARALAPMGQMGLKLFEQFLANAAPKPKNPDN